MFFTNFFRNFIVMKKFFCALLLMTAVVGCGKVVAQFNNNYWVFGDSAYIDWSNTAAPAVGNGPYYYRNGSSSIGNQNGLLMSAGLINNSAPLRSEERRVGK